jgi:hypothetical protein
MVGVMIGRDCTSLVSGQPRLNCRNQALTLKFRTVSIQSTSGAFESDRNLSEMEMFQQLTAKGGKEGRPSICMRC